MLLGTYEHSLDSKNRLTLPANLRKHLGKTISLSIGVDKCLEVRTVEAFQEYADTLKKMGMSKEANRRLLRTVLGNTFELPIDTANRILIPTFASENCNINKDVVIIGVGDKIEIWSADQYTNSKRIENINELSSVLEGIENLDDN